MLGALRPEIHDAQLVSVINHRPKALARCRRSVVVNQDELVSSSVEAAVARVQRVARHQQLQPRQGCGEDQQEAVRRCGARRQLPARALASSSTQGRGDPILVEDRLLRRGYVTGPASKSTVAAT